MGKISESISNQIIALQTQNTQELEFMRNRIIIVDNQKEDLISGISTVDKLVQDTVDEVNAAIKDVADAYQARITAGCRTLRTWSYIGFTTGTGGDPDTYTYQCIEVSPVGFAETTYIASGVGTGVVQYEPGSLLGITPKNLYGIKYYDEPHTKDVTDTFVGSFIGTIGVGSTILTVMNLANTGAIDEMSVGNLVVCNVTGALPGITSIVGFSTAVADLSSVGIGNTGDQNLVNTIILSSPSTVNVTSPLSAGGYGEFEVLKSSSQVDIEAIPMSSNALSPQTIGIMNSSTLGVGTFIEYDNSGNPNERQSWNPFLEGTELGDTTIEKPLVGAGKTYFYEGFTQAPEYPALSGTIAAVGTIIALEAIDSPSYFNLPSCSTEDSNLSSSISTLSTKESEFSSGLSVTNSRISVSNSLRKLRNRYSLQIWGLRQVISEINIDQDNLSAGLSSLEDSSISGVI